MLKKKDTQTETDVKQKPFYKKWWFWFIVVVIIIACAAAGTNDNQDSSVSNSSNQVESSESQKTENIDHDTIIRTLEENFYKSPEIFNRIIIPEVEDLEIRYNEDNDCYIVSYVITNAYGLATLFVRENISDYIDFCRLAYDIDNVNHIRVEIRGEGYLEDSSKMEDLVYFETSKKDFQAIDWETYEYEPVYDVISQCCNEFYIHKEILDNVEEPYDETIWYEGVSDKSKFFS